MPTKYPAREQLTQSAKRKILVRDGRKCVYCGEPATTVDHIVPWSVSYDHSESNLVAACARCNTIAGKQTFENLDEKRRYILANSPIIELRRNRPAPNKPSDGLEKPCADCGKLFLPAKFGIKRLLCKKCQFLDGCQRVIFNKQNSFDTVLKQPKSNRFIFARLGASLSRVKDLQDIVKLFRLSQAELGYLVGVSHPNGHNSHPYSRAAVNNWLAGRFSLTADVKEALADVVQVLASSVNEQMVTRTTFLKHKYGQPPALKIKVRYRCACGKLLDAPARACQHRKRGEP